MFKALVLLTGRATALESGSYASAATKTRPRPQKIAGSGAARRVRQA